MSILEKHMRGMDTPFEFEPRNVLKDGRLRVFILNEDMSYSEYFMKLPPDMWLKIKKKWYLVIAKCIVRGKYPFIVFYYNNPLPVLFEYKRSELSALKFRTQEEVANLTEEERRSYANVIMDSEAIQLTFTTNALRGLYARTGLTPKALIMILVVIAIIILIFLQVTGVVDVFGMLTGNKK